MSAVDQAWLKHAVERQIENIAADVRDIWERSGQIEGVIDEQAERFDRQANKINELVSAYNSINESFRKLCEFLARPAPPSPFSELFGHLATGMQQARPQRPQSRASQN